jgi:hypothetical protein
MKRKLALAIAVGALAVVFTLVVAACGGSSGSEGVASIEDTTGQTTNGDSGSAAAGEQDPQEAALAYAECMREHGIDMADPVAGRVDLNIQPGVPDGKVDKAMKACEDLLRSAGSQLTEEQQNVLHDAQLAFAKCMREHGIDMEDPKLDGSGIVTQKDTSGEDGVNPDDPKFQEAQKACEPILREARRKADLPESSGPGLSRPDGGS